MGLPGAGAARHAPVMTAAHACAGRLRAEGAPIMNTATRNYPAGDLRVSDADRDRALRELSEAFQAGRITADEFDARSEQALGARTGKELTGLLADLPRDCACADTTAHWPAHRELATRMVIGTSAAAAAALAAL